MCDAAPSDCVIELGFRGLLSGFSQIKDYSHSAFASHDRCASIVIIISKNLQEP